MKVVNDERCNSVKKKIQPKKMLSVKEVFHTSMMKNRRKLHLVRYTVFYSESCLKTPESIRLRYL